MFLSNPTPTTAASHAPCMGDHTAHVPVRQWHILNARIGWNRGERGRQDSPRRDRRGQNRTAPVRRCNGLLGAGNLAGEVETIFGRLGAMVEFSAGANGASPCKYHPPVVTGADGSAGIADRSAATADRCVSYADPFPRKADGSFSSADRLATSADRFAPNADGGFTKADSFAANADRFSTDAAPFAANADSFAPDAGWVPQSHLPFPVAFRIP